MNILVDINQKGGVGKTTNTIHLGSALAMMDYKTLLIDMDPQCNMTECLNIDPYLDQYNINNLLNPKDNTFKIKKRAENLYVVPGDVDFDPNDFKVTDLKNKLNNPSINFDFILIDVPPEKIINNNKKTTSCEIALTAADYFLITIFPAISSIRNVEKFVKDVFGLQKKHNKNLKPLGIHFSCVNEKTTLYKKYRKILEEKASNLLLNSIIRRDEEVRKSSDKGLTIFQYNPKSKAAVDYMNFTKEILSLIQNKN